MNKEQPVFKLPEAAKGLYIGRIPEKNIRVLLDSHTKDKKGEIKIFGLLGEGIKNNY